MWYGRRRTRLTPEQKAENAAKRAAKAATQKECQVCERHQSVKQNGRMVNHGYTRPGCGWLIGGCMGVGHKPFPETDALEAYLPVVVNHIEFATRQAASPSHYEFKGLYTRDQYNRRGKQQTILVHNFEEFFAAEVAAHQAADLSYRYWFTEDEREARQKWDSLVTRTKTRWATEADHAIRERARVEKRIAKGRELRGEK